MNEANAKCQGCQHYRPTAIFHLCTAKQSEYIVGERIYFHTIGHMRSRGGCTGAALYFRSTAAT